ncbi:protein BatD [Pseudomaricurvus alkylphenolicus]|uniref:BatD family protein n=1 Tax=Pseudomaricurvus alkylphenolicus TaxID=1306991 RepID=UPI00141F9336|nr:BatD family protein [Pseudomaricurvus alkylphenolicus]NIB42876.1 protein BatD [Pseudomaricurvus alkylphenolicus]
MSIFLICGCEWALAASTAEPRVRTQWIDAEGYATGEHWQPHVGEPVVLAVDVLTQTWFSRAPRFPGLQLRDVISLQSSSFATNFSERVNGVMYAVQRREYLLYPQRSGQFVIPGLELEVWVAGEDGPSMHKLRSLPMLLQVLPLPLVGKSSPAPPFVADEVSVSQQLQGAQGETWRLGDLVQRRVVIAAEGTPGMLIPALSMSQADGVQSALVEVRIDDQNDRGQLIGKRTEVYQYQLLREGVQQLPELTLTWWNRRQRDWETAQVPSLQLQVLPAVLAASEAVGTGIEFGWLRPILLLGALVLMALSALLWLVLQLARVGRRLWLKRKASEPYHYWILRLALRKRNPQAIITRYYAWVRCCEAEDVQTQQWLQDWAEVCAAVDDSRLLQKQIAVRLARELDARRLRLAGVEQKSKSEKRSDYLKPLNPA